MRHKLLRLLVLYRSILIWSFAINVFILIIKPYGFLAVSIKFVIAAVLLNSIDSENSNSLPEWLNNIRFNQVSTLMWLFMVDSLFTLLFFRLMKVYV